MRHYCNLSSTSLPFRPIGTILKGHFAARFALFRAHLRLIIKKSDFGPKCPVRSMLHAPYLSIAYKARSSAHNPTGYRLPRNRHLRKHRTASTTVDLRSSASELNPQSLNYHLRFKPACPATAVAPTRGVVRSAARYVALYALNTPTSIAVY